MQNNINEAPPKEPSWEDGDKWANAIGASQGLAQSIQICAATSSTATPGWTGSCINTIGNNALQVTSQVGGAGGMPHVAAFVTKRWVF